MHQKYILISLLAASASAIWPFDDDETSSGSSATATSSGSSTTTGSGGIGSFFGLGGDDSSSSSSGGSSASATSSGSASGSGSSTTESQSSSSSTDSGGIGSYFGLGGSSLRNPYAPYETQCPDSQLIRLGNKISNEEAEYISNRQVNTNKNLIDYLLNTANLSDFNAELFVNNAPKNITIGLAFSGGGYRAMLNGAGQLLGLDDRFDEAKSSGLGGILQSATYLVGLSGGNWLVGSIVLNDFISVAEIVDGSAGIWDLLDSIFNPGGINVLDTTEYYKDVYDSVSAKDDAGFDVSITDVWGRALSSQFFKDGNGGINITWSSIRNLSTFKSHEMPFPIVVSNGRTPGTTVINENSTVFETNPYELGSWDPSLRSFTNTEYMGSFVDNGTNSSQKCYANFDNAGYVMGTSSSLFNAVIFNLPSSNSLLSSAINSALTSVLNLVSSKEIDIATYYPNPFSETDYGDVKTISQNDTLYLCDGGEDGQNVPFYPLIQTPRGVDLIIAFDNSADTDENWPNGTSIIDTYQRQFTDQGKGSPFPYVPPVDEMAKLTNKPVFFGCDAANMSDIIDYHGDKDLNVTDIPLIIQVFNTRESYNSNTSTYKMSYDSDEVLGIIQNGFEVTTRKNLTDDSDWAKCVGCAAIRRTQERLGETQSDECKSCFESYCWTGGKEGAASSQAPLPSSSTSASGSATAGATSSSTKKKGDGNKNALSSRILTTITSVLLMFIF